MGITERKEREKQEMRDKILQVATKMFLEDGFEKTSIRNIAEAIEYSPATIYLYFKDKDELFFAIHEIGFQKLLQRLDVLKDIKDPVKRLRELGFIYINFALENPEYYDLMFIMLAPMNSLHERVEKGEIPCWHFGEQTFKLLIDTVQEGMDKGLIRGSNAGLAAMYMWSAVHGMVSLDIRGRLGVLDLPEDQLRNTIITALDELVGLMKA